MLVLVLELSSGGYERPMWFALNNEKSEFKYSYNYQNWYPSVEFETKNARENVGLFDLTAFSKYDLKRRKSVTVNCKKFVLQT